MPINSTLLYVKGLLDNLTWPIPNLPALQCQITPPDPNVDAQIPQAYVWPSRGDETRDSRRGGTLPRATSQGAPSGLKAQTHHVSLWLVWFQADDDPDADTLFPGMVDWVMASLRVTENPSPIQDDVWSPSIQSYLIDIGEVMDYEITLRAILDQRYNRYDALLNLTINEVFPS